MLFLVAGPDGAGKTTYAYRQIRSVSGSARFVNLDEIARGLSPLDPEAEASRAARVALDLTHDLIRSGESFSLETTLAGKTHLRTIAAARNAGFRVVLLHFAVREAGICLARIERRVSEGGHDVPEPDVRRRFARSLANLPAYAAQTDLWRIFDTSSLPPKVYVEGSNGCTAMLGDLTQLPRSLAEWLSGLPNCEG